VGKYWNKLMVVNWRTSLAGAAVAFGALADMATQFATGHVDPARLWTDLTALAGAVGLVHARDAAVSSKENAQANG
jgi:hypothetical protein